MTDEPFWIGTGQESLSGQSDDASIADTLATSADLSYPFPSPSSPPIYRSFTKHTDSSRIVESTTPTKETATTRGRAGRESMSENVPEKEKSVIPIRYHVKYKDNRGTIIRVEKSKEAFTLKPVVSDSPVLEVFTTVTAIDSDLVAAPAAKKKGRRKKKTKGSTRVDDEEGDDSAPLEEVEQDTGLEIPENNEISSTVLRIRSQKLINALRAVVRYYPGQTLLGDTVQFEEPFQLLVHHRTELKEYKNKNEERHSEEYKRVSNEHIDILLKFLKDHFGKSLEDEEERHKEYPPTCTFEYFWLLMKPGEAIYATWNRGQLLPHTVKMVSGGMVKGRPTTYEVSAWNINFDAYELGRQSVRFAVLPFDGEKEIKSLLAYPTRFYKDPPKSLKALGGLKLEDVLIDRGRKFWELTKGHSYKEYDGHTVTRPYRNIKGRIMVDFDSYYAHKGAPSRPCLSGTYIPDEAEDGGEMATGTSGCECSDCAAQGSNNLRQGLFSNYDCVDPQDEPPNRQHFFFMCTRVVPAFILKDRKWELLNVEHVNDVVQLQDPLSNLVLNEDLKNTIEALSRTHVRSKSYDKIVGADFIKGKGEGQIFLLHGPPGVGKTCTAECVAELTERPLLALTCGDIGTTAEKVEESLETYLTLGELWGAVVLLDEADIYLEKRLVSDAKRNSLVSVFLRALEYYRGLLFLTTNRVCTFDEAFKSRIHVSLHYKRLGPTERTAIWTNCLKRLEAESVKVTPKAWQYVTSDREVVELQWNGREIRNAFQTAVALAQFEAGSNKGKQFSVRSDHIRRVVGMAEHFTKFLEGARHGRNDAEIAKREGLRNDSYDQPKPSKKAEVAAAAATAAAAKKKKLAADKKRLAERLAEMEAMEDEEVEIGEEEESEGELVKPADPKHKKKTTTRVKETIVEEEEEDNEVDEEEEEVKPKPKKKIVKVSKPAAKLDDEEEDD